MFFRYTELDCLLDGHKHLLEDVKKLDRNAILLLRRGTFYRHTRSYHFCQKWTKHTLKFMAYTVCPGTLHSQSIDIYSLFPVLLD